jgi:hypothetical protein
VGNHSGQKLTGFSCAFFLVGNPDCQNNADIQAGYTVSFIVSATQTAGVNQAFEAWGDKLLGTYGKSRALTYRDYSLNYLGYSTDNGAFYYYQTEDHQVCTPALTGAPASTGALA